MNDTPQLARILIIDDDDTLRSFVGELLLRNGYEALYAANAQEGLRLAGTGADISRRPDLILLDVLLPDASGFDVCADLKRNARTADIPVVFLTANREDTLRGFEVGGVDYVVKPFDVAVLLARVRTHTALSLLSQDLQQALNERTASLEAANLRLRELNLDMALIEERQRRLLAQQLHDTTIQQLVLARILIESDKSPGSSSDKLLGLVTESLQQLRTLVFELSSPVLGQSGLFAAVEWVAEELGERWGIEFDCLRRGDERQLPESVSLTLFQGTRELLINIAKHAESPTGDIVVVFEPDSVEVIVGDDGRGFVDAMGQPMDPLGQPRAAPNGSGFGLRNLRSRLEVLGGVLRLRERPGGGAQVYMRVPLKETPDTADL